MTDPPEIEFDEKRQARCLPTNQPEFYMTIPTLTSVIRMAHTIAQRELQAPKRETTPDMKQTIESVLKMIEAKSGNGVEIHKLAKLVRQAL